MKRLTILWIIVLMGVMMVSCRKQEEVTISYIINTEAYSDYDSMQTVVTVTATCVQGGTEKAPVGTAYLIILPHDNIGRSDSLIITEYTLDQTCTFYVPESIRPLDNERKYYVTIQIPFSTPIRSKISAMPLIPHHSFISGDNSFVKFSPGNLQYKASTNTWRFAEEQYHSIGKGNENISSTYNDWIDLFGYGTSGHEYMPYDYKMDSTLYAIGDINKTKHDWGVHCDITNGGDYEWSTPTYSEWSSILVHRRNADKHRALATVNNVKGLILLPEDWRLPPGCNFKADANIYTTNEYTVEEWEMMENAGAVFFPATGYREGNSLIAENEGRYYSSSWFGGYNPECGHQPYALWIAKYREIRAYYFHSENTVNYYGYSVRLIRTVKE